MSTTAPDQPATGDCRTGDPHRTDHDDDDGIAMAEHVVKKASDLNYQTPAEFVGHSSGYSGDNVVDEAARATQMGFRVARLEPGGSVGSHVHSWEESLYVTAGSLTVDTAEGSVELVAGDYGLLPVGSTHAFRNTSAEPVLFSEMKAPLPRARFGFDTQFPRRLLPERSRRSTFVTRATGTSDTSTPSRWTRPTKPRIGCR